MSHSKSKDFYRVLQVKPTASKLEIKDAYRKLALALHPDRHDGCDIKTREFKEASEAYRTLSDHETRKQYDTVASASWGGHFNYGSGTSDVKPKAPPPNYRKVYSPRAPKGMKTFDPKKHYEMHYGEGMMKEEVERARRRAEKASGRLSGFEYESPLGKGFTFSGTSSADNKNPYSKRSRQGPPPPQGGGGDIEYEEKHYFDMNSSDATSAKRVIRSREIVRERVQERRNNRAPRPPPEEQQQQRRQQQQQQQEGCTIM
eukprot:scaffold61394_cov43-Attheya_sp.AAC.1